MLEPLANALSELSLAASEKFDIGQFPDAGPSAAKDTGYHDLVLDVRQALAALPAAQRAVLVLRYWADSQLFELTNAGALPTFRR